MTRWNCDHCSTIRSRMELPPGMLKLRMAGSSKAIMCNTCAGDKRFKSSLDELLFCSGTCQRRWPEYCFDEKSLTFWHTHDRLSEAKMRPMYGEETAEQPQDQLSLSALWERDNALRLQLRGCERMACSGAAESISSVALLRLPIPSLCDVRAREPAPPWHSAQRFD